METIGFANYRDYSFKFRFPQKFDIFSSKSQEKSRISAKDVCITFAQYCRREIKTEIQALKSSIKLLTERCNAMEQSQDFISKKYDTLIQALQSSKGETVKLDNKYKEITDLLEEKRDELAQMTRKHEETLYCIECSLDNHNVACFILLFFMDQL